MHKCVLSSLEVFYFLVRSVFDIVDLQTKMKRKLIFFFIECDSVTLDSFITMVLCTI